MLSGCPDFPALASICNLEKTGQLMNSRPTFICYILLIAFAIGGNPPLLADSQVTSELDRAQEHYDKQVAGIAAENAAAKNDLRKKYLAALFTLETVLSNDGDLDGVLSLLGERHRVDPDLVC